MHKEVFDINSKRHMFKSDVEKHLGLIVLICKISRIMM